MPVKVYYPSVFFDLSCFPSMWHSSNLTKEWYLYIFVCVVSEIIVSLVEINLSLVLVYAFMLYKLKIFVI